MSTALATRGSDEQSLTRSIDEFRVYSKHAPGGEAVPDLEERVNAIATISAGRRNDKGGPERSRDGTIYVHGHAPGLEAALRENGNKCLTVMFMSDEPRDFIKQNFMAYTQTKLEVFGDTESLTVVSDRGHITYPAGTQGYEQAFARCKTCYSVYFTLAVWTAEGARAIFPDGLGFYRLRTTSEKSIRSILAQLRFMAKLAGGHIAAIPFDLFHVEREHSDGTGVKRRVPIWQLVSRPPQGITLDSKRVRAMIQQSVEDRTNLQLEPPADESMDDVEGELIRGAITDDEASILADGGLCDVEFYRAKWFATVKGTHLDTDAARHQFISRLTIETCSSLADFLASATPDNADRLINAALDEIEFKRVEAEHAAAAAGQANANAAAGARTMPGDEEGDAATRNELDAAIAAYHDAVARARAAGRIMNPWDVERATYRQIVNRTEKILAGLNAKAQPTANGATAPAPAQSAQPAQTAQPAQPKTFGDAIAEAQAARDASRLDNDEADPFDVPEEELNALAGDGAAEGSGSAPLAECTLKLMKGLAVHGHDLQGNLTDGPTIAAINAWYYRANGDSPGLEISSLDEVPAGDVALILRAIAEGTMVIHDEEPAGAADA